MSLPHRPQSDLAHPLLDPCLCKLARLFHCWRVTTRCIYTLRLRERARRVRQRRRGRATPRIELLTLAAHEPCTIHSIDRTVLWVLTDIPNVSLQSRVRLALASVVMLAHVEEAMLKQIQRIKLLRAVPLCFDAALISTLKRILHGRRHMLQTRTDLRWRPIIEVAFFLLRVDHNIVWVMHAVVCVHWHAR